MRIVQCLEEHSRVFVLVMVGLMAFSGVSTKEIPCKIFLFVRFVFSSLHHTPFVLFLINSITFFTPHSFCLFCEFSFTLQDDSEVCYQFSSGIKTIVVVPVEPRGLVQFGSTEKIFERLDFVDQTMRLFQEKNFQKMP
ncbi:uncharacterized protein LOC133816337 [Humulus lupulus]|uniref:uncharacterized protein LOC133816337 n=1 Tax=Humulus lupulus TaxID=3486 RepID=UPI002B4185D9|nr:uncharacterized protein LOC133816337 [Humulus lupulus]